jgi:tRNA(His) 5'-end guanylyltransferase
MLGQCHFSHKELHKKSCNDIQDMLMTQKGINFNDMPTEFKRGVCCCRDENGKWFINKEIPIFSQDREYIERVFRVGEKNEVH